MCSSDLLKLKRYAFGLTSYFPLPVLALFLLLIFAAPLPAFSQDDIKARLFNEVENLLAQANAEQASLLSPEKYQKAVEKHERALGDYDKGKSVTAKIPEILELLKSAIENAKLAQVTFSHLLNARDEAIEANSIEYAKDQFEEAERLFIEATGTMEKGDLNKAKEKGLNAEKLFRDAELNAIKVSIIGSVKNKLAEAEKKKVSKYAPITLSRSQALLAEAESILTSNRSAKNEAKEKAELAEYEVKHAEYLASKIRDLLEDELNWEKLILEDETLFGQILTELSFTPCFDQGFAEPTKSSVNAIANLKKEKQDLAN